MASDWLEVTLGDVLNLKRGYDLPHRERGLGSVPLVSSSGISDHVTGAMVKGPGVVTGRYGTLGQVFYIEEDFWPLNTTLYVQDFKGNDERFISYFLRSLDFLAYSDKAAVPGLNRNHLHQARVRIPADVAEQRAIASVLGALDNKSKLNRRMGETLEAMAQALFKSWFVDFDPVRAKAEGRASGLPADLDCLFPNRLDASEVGPRPHGWPLSRLGDDFHLTMGESPPGETYNDLGQGLPFYQGRRDFGFRLPTRRVYCTAPTRLAHAGDTLVSVRAPVGDINLALEDCAIGRGVAAVRHRSGARSFTYLSMTSLEHVFSRFEAEGTVFGAINKDDLRAIPLLQPPAKVIQAFERLVEPLDDRIISGELQRMTLTRLRDALLPKMMSGEVLVPNAEPIAVEAGA